MKNILTLICLFTFSYTHSQTITLPYDFETSTTFTNFDGGTGTRVANPASGGINTSANVGRMVRNGGQVWAGAYLTITANVDFSVNPVICMKVYTTAPIGTNVSFKMEGCGGGCSNEIAAFTSFSGTWETLCWDFTGSPTIYNRLVLLFDLGNIGNGSSASTFFFDDIEQLVVLSVEMSEFAVEELDGDAVINWTTATEINNDYFEVRRSKDGLNFETIGVVQGNGNASSANRYSFTDPDPIARTSYYQLAQVDFNGSGSYSKIVSLNIDALENFRLYPNPTSGQFILSNSFKENTEFKIEINDMIGRTLALYSASAGPGVFQRIMDLSPYPTGSYTVQIKTPTEAKVLKLIKEW